MSKIHDIVIKEDWKKIDKKFEEIMSRDVFKVGDRVRVYHQEKGLIEGKLKFIKDGILEIQDDEGSFHTVNKKYCRILKQGEEIENKSNIFQNKINQNKMNKQKELTSEQKIQLDELFKDGRKEMHNKCKDEKNIHYAKVNGLYAFAAAREVSAPQKHVDIYLKEKGYIGGKILNKNGYTKKNPERKSLHKNNTDSHSKKITDMGSKFLATCYGVDKQNLGNDTILLTLKLKTGDNITIGNILISEILLESIG
jgi:hypothetical protein